MEEEEEVKVEEEVEVRMEDEEEVRVEDDEEVRMEDAERTTRMYGKNGRRKERQKLGGRQDDTGSSIRTGKKYDDTVALWGFTETYTWS